MDSNKPSSGDQGVALRWRPMVKIDDEDDDDEDEEEDDEKDKDKDKNEDDEEDEEEEGWSSQSEQPPL
jgi:hypothetical protein